MTSGWDVRSVTAWPRSRACSAICVPVRPVKMLVMPPMRSIGVRVFPAVTHQFIVEPPHFRTQAPLSSVLRRLLPSAYCLPNGGEMFIQRVVEFGEDIRQLRFKWSGLLCAAELLQISEQDRLGFGFVAQHQVDP